MPLVYTFALFRRGRHRITSQISSITAGTFRFAVLGGIPNRDTIKKKKAGHLVSEENFVEQAVKVIAEEKDSEKVFPYSTAKIDTCLKVVLAWESILDCTISYTEALLKGHPYYLENEETGMIIDSVP